MSKFLRSTMVVSGLVDSIARCVGAFSKDVEIGLDETAGLNFSVKVSVCELADNSWGSADLEIFCKQNELKGSMFFNKDGTVSFIFSPDKASVTSEKMEIYIPAGTNALEPGRMAIVPRLTEEIFDQMHSGNKIPAVKAYRQANQVSLAESKIACEQGYLLEISERGLTPYKFEHGSTVPGRMARSVS